MAILRNYRVVVGVTTLLLAVASGAKGQNQNHITYDLYDVSLPHFSLAPGEQVEAFRCEVRGALLRINTPLEWNVSLDNGTGGRSLLTAHVVVGAAAFDSNHLAYFHDFATIAGVKAPPGGALASYFDVRVVLSISNKMDEVRELTLSKKQLVLKPMRPSALRYLP
jgi:hypothetical protein